MYKATLTGSQAAALLTAVDTFINTRELDREFEALLVEGMWSLMKVTDQWNEERGVTA